MGKPYAGGVALVAIERSGFVEGWHRGSYVVLDAAGQTVASGGDATGAVLPRSSNKPFQAVGMLRLGLRVTDPRDLALVAASHSGEDFHLEHVRALLAAAGLTEQDLRCPADWRLSQQCGPDKRAVYMNCSGKHSGMLLTCVANSWSTDDYYRPEHPLQRHLTAAIEEFAGESASAVAVDGCGAPAIGISLTGLAAGFLRLGSDPDGKRVADAMHAHPDYVSGTNEPDDLLMRAVPGLVSKGGAEGVWAAAIPGVGAVALKIDDGAMRARGPVMLAALRQLGVEVTEPRLTPPLLGRGEPVGALRPLPLLG